MNGMRVARKYIKTLTDQDLHGILGSAKDDPSTEGLVVYYLIKSELEYRNMGEIRKALKSLGIKGDVTTRWITEDRIAVYINNEEFGIWDTVRKTFVD